MVLVSAAPAEGVLAVGALELEAAALELVWLEDAELETLAELLELDEVAALLLETADELVLVAALLLTEAELEPPALADAALSPPPPHAEIRTRVSAAAPVSLYCLFIFQIPFKKMRLFPIMTLRKCERSLNWSGCISSKVKGQHLFPAT